MNPFKQFEKFGVDVEDHTLVSFMEAVWKVMEAQQIAEQAEVELNIFKMGAEDAISNMMQTYEYMFASLKDSDSWSVPDRARYFCGPNREVRVPVAIGGAYQAPEEDNAFGTYLLSLREIQQCVDEGIDITVVNEMFGPMALVYSKNSGTFMGQKNRYYFGAHDLERYAGCSIDDIDNKISEKMNLNGIEFEFLFDFDHGLVAVFAEYWPYCLDVMSQDVPEYLSDESERFNKLRWIGEWITRNPDFMR